MVSSVKYTLFQLDKVILDIDEAVLYYNSKQNGLGRRFYLAYKKSIKIIQTTPHFRIFYKDIRCFQIDKFPYLIHFSVDDNTKQIFIEAVICAYKNPDDAYLKK